LPLAHEQAGSFSPQLCSLSPGMSKSSVQAGQMHAPTSKTASVASCRFTRSGRRCRSCRKSRPERM